jgi:uncharacterized protein (DUF58 family)
MNEQKSRTKREGMALLKTGVPVLFLMYLFTPQRAVQFLTLFLVILILGSKAYSEYLVRHLRLIRRDSELRAFRNEWLDVELQIENSGRLPAFMLALGDFSGGIAVFRNIKRLCTLWGRSRQLFQWEVLGSERGVYTIGPASIRGCDPLGLFPFTLSFAETSKLYIYPSPAFVALKSPGGIPLGNLITPDPFYEDLTRPRSLRDYSPGDESKRINWKASARMYGSGAGENLLVNEYEPSLSYPMIVFLNADPREYEIKNRGLYIERVIEAAAALCLMAARERQTLGLILHTAEANYEEQDSSVINPAAFTLILILERLAALQPFRNMNQISSLIESEGSPRPSVQRLLEKGRVLAFGTRLVYVGPSLEDADYNALETLRKRRLSLEYLIISEKNLESGSDNRARGSRKHQMKDSGYAVI